MARFNVAAFGRVCAHRGLHGPRWGAIENSATAFELAIAHGLAIECDLQPAADGTPMVFHDFTLDRLTGEVGRLDARTPEDLRGIRLNDSGDGILTFSEFCELVAGRVPLLVEIKGAWGKALDERFIAEICRIAREQSGKIALMSFHVDILCAVGAKAPSIPRGILSMRFDRHHVTSQPQGNPGQATVATQDGEHGDDETRLDPQSAYRLAHLIDAATAQPSFIGYGVRDLPTPVTRYCRQARGLPVLAWTVRTPGDLRRAAHHADVAIFEDLPPEEVKRSRVMGGV